MSSISSLYPDTELSIARGKLQALGTTKDFAVRMMNLAEYKKLVGTAQTSMNETWWENERPFSEYLRKSVCDGWIATARSQTRWSYSLGCMKHHKRCIELLTEARQRTRHVVAAASPHGEKPWQQSLRDQLLQAAEGYRSAVLNVPLVVGKCWGLEKQVANESRRLISHTIGEAGLQEIETEVEKAVQARISSGAPTFGPDIDKAFAVSKKYTKADISHSIQVICREKEDAALFGTASLDTIQNFFDDDTFLRHKGNVAKLVRALTFSPPETMAIGNMRQYHVAAVFSRKALDFQAVMGRWQMLAFQKNMHPHLLGAVAMIPDTQLLGEMVSISSRAGEAAHPIFTAKGLSKYPHKS